MLTESNKSKDTNHLKKNIHNYLSDELLLIEQNVLSIIGPDANKSKFVSLTLMKNSESYCICSIIQVE